MTREPISVGKPWEKTIAFALGVITEGRLLHTSGITARDPDGTLVGVGDIRAQIEQCFKNVGDVLRTATSSTAPPAPSWRFAASSIPICSWRSKPW